MIARRPNDNSNLVYPFADIIHSADSAKLKAAANESKLEPPRLTNPHSWNIFGTHFKRISTPQRFSKRTTSFDQYYTP